jgi:hypothetical protein
MLPALLINSLRSAADITSHLVSGLRSRRSSPPGDDMEQIYDARCYTEYAPSHTSTSFVEPLEATRIGNRDARVTQPSMEHPCTPQRRGGLRYSLWPHAGTSRDRTCPCCSTRRSPSGCAIHMRATPSAPCHRAQFGPARVPLGAHGGAQAARSLSAPYSPSALRLHQASTR